MALATARRCVDTNLMNTDAATLIELLEQNVSRVVLGKAEAVRLAVVALLAGEHILLEDIPGVGKTLMGKAIARSLAGRFHRIQFTPDLLPADITGQQHVQQSDAGVCFQPGSGFCEHSSGGRDQSSNAANAERALGVDERPASLG